MSNLMNFSLKLVNPDQVKLDILKAMHATVKKNFKKYGEFLESSISYQLSVAIENSPTLQSLKRGGDLAGELGVDFFNAAEIIMAVAYDSTTVKVEVPKLVGNQIVGKMTVTAAPSDLETITARMFDSGIQETEKGQQLEYMKWLLTLGDAVIVRDYEVKAGFPKFSRTGDKIMVKGGGWRVPPEHAGSEGNNFITRAIDEALPKVEKEMVRLFTDALITGSA